MVLYDSISVSRLYFAAISLSIFFECKRTYLYFWTGFEKCESYLKAVDCYGKLIEISPSKICLCIMGPSGMAFSLVT